MMISARARLLLSFAVFGVLWGSWGAVIPAIQRQTRLSDGQLGFALLGAVVGALLFMRALAGGLDRLGPAAVPAAMLVLAAGAVLPGRAHSAVGLFVSLLLVGVGSGALDVAVNAAGAELQQRSGRQVLPAAHGCYSFGVLGGALAGGAARQEGVSAGGVLAGVAVLLAVVALVSVATGSRPVAGGGDGPEPDGSDGLRDSIERRTLLFLGLLCGMSFLVEDALQNWGSVHLEHTFHARPFVSGAATAVFGLAAGLARLTLPRWSRGHGADIVVRSGSAAAAAGLLLTAAAPDAYAALAGLAVAGAGLGACAPMLMALAGGGAPASRARAVSLVTTVSYVGFVLGPPFTGGAAGVAGLRAAFGCLAVLTVALALLAGRIRPAPVVGKRARRSSPYSDTRV